MGALLCKTGTHLRAGAGAGGGGGLALSMFWVKVARSGRNSVIPDTPESRLAGEDTKREQREPGKTIFY